MKLYYHKTDGGAEYLTDKFITCPDGHKEGSFEGAEYIVRIDGDITKDARLIANNSKFSELIRVARAALTELCDTESTNKELINDLDKAINEAIQ